MQAHHPDARCQAKLLDQVHNTIPLKHYGLRVGECLGSKVGPSANELHPESELVDLSTANLPAESCGVSAAHTVGGSIIVWRAHAGPASWFCDDTRVALPSQLDTLPSSGWNQDWGAGCKERSVTNGGSWCMMDWMHAPPFTPWTRSGSGLGHTGRRRLRDGHRRPACPCLDA